MGQEILYCFQCGTRITGAELEKGKAKRAGVRVACLACVPALLEALTSAERAALEKSATPAPSSRQWSPVRPSSTVRLPKAPPAPRSWIWVAAGAGLLVVVGLGAAMLSSKPPPEPPPKEIVRPAPESPRKEEPPSREAREALDRALALVQSRPADVDAQIAAFEEALRKTDRSPLHPEAMRGHDAAVARRKEAELKESAAVEHRVRDALAREDVKAARDAGAPTSRARELEAEARSRAEEIFTRLRAAAADALRRNAPGELPALRERVARWGYEDLLRAFDAALVPAPAKSTASLDYAARWSAAAVKAAGRDFDAARADVLREARGGAAEEVRREAEADAKDLEALGILIQAFARDVAPKLAGQGLVLGVRGGKTVEGRLVRADASRAELRPGEGPSAFVEWSDAAGSTLARLIRESRPSATPEERRALALLCLLDGEVAAARDVLRGPDELVPGKAWDYAKEAAARIPAPPPKELQARALFYEAERSFDVLDTRAAAMEKYRVLLADFGDTRLAAIDGARLRARADAGRETLLGPADLAASPAFQRAASPKVAAFWTSREDRDEAAALEAYVDALYFGRSDAPYRAWAYVGVCCLETAEAYLQGTGFTETDAKTRKKVAVELGSAYASPLKVTFSGLKAKHAAHATKGEPKAPARWDWVSIPLPKYAEAGPKALRIASAQKGFSVAAVFVSALRTSPPPDAELKDLLARAVAPPELPAAPVAWRAVFDGRTLDWMRQDAKPNWKVDGGVIVPLPSSDRSAVQSNEEFGDGDLRIRFEIKGGLESAYIGVRQGGGGKAYLKVEGQFLSSLAPGPHELLFQQKGDQVKGVFDGKAIVLSQEGTTPLTGRIQLNCRGEGLRILAVEWRDVKP